jgi:hypothetical protein
MRDSASAVFPRVLGDSRDKDSGELQMDVTDSSGPLKCRVLIVDDEPLDDLANGGRGLGTGAGEGSGAVTKLG